MTMLKTDCLRAVILHFSKHATTYSKWT